MPPIAFDRNHTFAVVRERLRSVEKSLVQFQESPQDAEAMHDLRVACRRAESVLRVCRDVLPPQPGKWLRKHLRELRHLSNVYRDNEVLHQWLKDQRRSWARNFQKTLQSEHRDERVRIVEFIGGLLRRNRFANHAKSVCSREDERTLDDERRLIAGQFLDDLWQFMQSLPTGTASASQLHQFRIACKRWRYTIECMCEIFPKASFGTLARILPQIQERLGELHDLEVRQNRLKQWAQHTGVALECQESTAESQRLLDSWKTWWRSSRWESAVGTAVTKILGMLCEK